jgi:hypothetical protein
MPPFVWFFIVLGLGILPFALLYFFTERGK